MHNGCKATANECICFHSSIAALYSAVLHICLILQEKHGSYVALDTGPAARICSSYSPCVLYNSSIDVLSYVKPHIGSNQSRIDKPLGVFLRWASSVLPRKLKKQQVINCLES